jgi:AraC family transcriptional regulator
MDITQLAVEQAISTMWSRYSEPLSLTELADSAVLSKFYFSRVFRSTTGISPGRFLTAVRLFKAKNLLLETTLSVTQIAFHVGYNSLGTFTSRFTRSVGISPGRYRAMSSASTHALRPPACCAPGPQARSCELSGSVRIPVDEPLRVYVGAFTSPVVEGIPAACAILERSGSYTLRDVPCGTWYIQAAAVGLRDLDPRPWARRPALLGSGGPVVLRPEGPRPGPDLRMRPATPADLPILLALPELDNWDVPELDPVG